MATIITLHRTDLGVSTVTITAAEFDRCTDIIEREFDAAKIDFQTVSYTDDRWNLRIEDGADVDSAKAIIDSAIEGGFGEWTDDACMDAAVDHFNATRGESGGTWWGEGFAGVTDATMADVGWLLMQGRLDEAGEVVNEKTCPLDTDIADDDLRELAEATFGLERREDGTWGNDRFNALPTDALIHAGRMLRRGDEEEARGVLVDNDEPDDEMDDDEAIAYAVDALDAEYDSDAGTWYLLRGGKLVFRGISADDMAEAGREIRRDGNAGDWEGTLRYRSDFDH